MSEIRPSTQHQRLAVKAAFRRGLNRAGGGASFCHATRVGEATLSKYAAAHDAEHFPPIDVVLDLDLDIGAPAMLSELAALEGYGLTKVTASNQLPGIEDVAVLARSACDVQVSLSNALADGRISRREAKHTITDIDAALEDMRCLRSRLSEILQTSDQKTEK